MDSDFVGSIFAFICGGTFLILFIASVIWAYNDANQRGKSGCLWTLIIWFTWPFGFIAYLLLRDRDVRL